MHQSTPAFVGHARAACDLEEFEHAVFSSMCEAARAEASASLRCLDDELSRSVPRGLAMKDRRVRRVLTRFGELKIARRRYVDEHGASRYLLDERLGLEPRRRISPALERSVVRLAASVSFREAAETIAELTAADVSRSTAHSAIARTGDRVREQAVAAAADLHDLGLVPSGTQAADPLFCEADGTVIALQQAPSRRAEVKLAVFYGDKADETAVVHAAFGPARTFWREASARAGGVFDLAGAGSVVVSGDGANWVRGGLDAMPGARFVLDPFHVNRALLQATGSWAAARSVGRGLYREGLGSALSALDRFAKDKPERAKELARVASYLESNADGLWRHEPSLGSIENHIDKVLANRFKKRGRRWSPRGADRMARVIAAQRSGERLPVGSWHPPEGRDPKRPLRPSELAAGPRCPKQVRRASVTGREATSSLSRVLRGLSGTKLDW